MTHNPSPPDMWVEETTMTDFINSMVFLAVFLTITAVCAWEAIDKWV